MESHSRLFNNIYAPKSKSIIYTLVVLKICVLFRSHALLLFVTDGMLIHQVIIAQSRSHLFEFFQLREAVPRNAPLMDTMTAPSSPSLPIPYRDGQFLKDLDQLKKLIQRTTEEYATCQCGDRLTSKGNVSTDNERMSNLENLLEDFRRESVENSQFVNDGKGAEASKQD